MARKRKRVPSRGSLASSSENHEENSVVDSSSSSASIHKETSKKQQLTGVRLQQTRLVGQGGADNGCSAQQAEEEEGRLQDDIIMKGIDHGAGDDCSVQLEPPHGEKEDEEGSSTLPGIPWALPSDPDKTLWVAGIDEEEDDSEEDEDEEDDGEEEDEEEEEEEEEEDNKKEENSEGALESEPNTTGKSCSSIETDADNRWKQHPDRRRSITATAATAAAGGPSTKNLGRGKRAARSIRNSGGRTATNGRAGGGREDDASMREENGGVRDNAGYYGPRVDAPPCRVFEPSDGKVRRVRGSGSDPAAAPDALVVGLRAREKLCFVGAARVRCGRGQADLSGFTLLPVPWGPYVEAHSPRWMSLLAVRALDAEEYLDVSGAEKGGATSRAVVDDGCDDGEDFADTEGEVEEAIDIVGERFPVVVVLRRLPEGPLSFMTAQADADALYSPDSAANAPRRKSARNNRAQQEGETVPSESATGGDFSDDRGVSPGVQLAAELHLPGMQVVTAEAAGLCPFSVSQEWSDAVDVVIRSPHSTDTGLVLVCGAKGVGKSTLCRYLVNRMLGRHPKVAYMDCDLGQPEFTTPGLLSLHLLDAPVLGPPHSNIHRPDLAYFIGTTTSKPEPLLYSAAIRALAEQAVARQQPSSSFAGDGSPPAPLVVNTDGWVKGMGEDLLGATIDAVRPRHIVQILGKSAAKMFELDRLPEGCQVHRVGAWSPPPSPVGRTPPAPSRPSPQDLRTLRLVSYFLGQGTRGTGRTKSALEGGVAERGKGVGSGVVGASLRGGALYDQDHTVAAWLAAATPRRVPWRAIQVRVMNSAVAPSVVMHAVNGALVGLIAAPASSQQAARGVQLAEGGLACLPETPLAPCVGLGIVRSVDVEKRVLFVLTPEPVEVLRQVNVLVRGSLQLPMEMLYDPSWCSHPYFSSEAVGGEVIKSRYLMRRGSTQ